MRRKERKGSELGKGRSEEERKREQGRRKEDSMERETSRAGTEGSNLETKN